jgi:aminoglycoside phosphotransferase (APT) family kinase protein
MPQGLDADGRTALVRRLLSGALPGAADQPLRRLTTSGTEHDVWRIGADLVLRLPRDADAETGLRKESAWWPLLRPHLPEWLAVPEIVHAGEPSEDFPRTWLVSRWVPGTDAAAAVLAGADHESEVAWGAALSEIVTALRGFELGTLAPAEWPAGGRGGHLRDRLADLATTDPVAGRPDPAPIRGLIDRALAVTPPAERVLLHGDLIPGNLLLTRGRLSGLIDLGTLTTGFPAWDLTCAWWVLGATGRRRLRDRLDVDDASWVWGRALAATQGLLADWYYAPRGHALAPLGARAVRECLSDLG